MKTEEFRGYLFLTADPGMTIVRKGSSWQRSEVIITQPKNAPLYEEVRKKS